MQIKKCLTRSHLLSIMHSKPSPRMVNSDHLRRNIKNRIIAKENFSKTPSSLHDFNCRTSSAKGLIFVFNQGHSIFSQLIVRWLSTSSASNLCNLQAFMCCVERTLHIYWKTISSLFWNFAISFDAPLFSYCEKE